MSPRFNTLAEWLSWQETLHPSSIDMGLDRLGRTLGQLHWRRPACPVVTVGGTNGKGSSVALLSGILAAAGYRVGTFTSPHLLRYNERITIAGQEVSDASLIAAFERIEAARGADTLTFFEFNTLAALLAFETAGLDAIVLEVGMGGRLDAVNVIDADVALVTSVALDHCEWLGSDVETIAREKAGIFRAGRPAVFGSREPPRSVVEIAGRLGSDLLLLGRDFDYSRSGSAWSWRGRVRYYENLPAPGLRGDLQYDNAAAVLAAIEMLADAVTVPQPAIEQGLRSLSLPGRFQRIVTRSARGAIEWILDVAHNPAAANSLAGQLRAYPAAARTIAICGILGDKDIAGVARELVGQFDAWMAVGLGGVRALQPEVLAEQLRANVDTEITVAVDVAAACASATQLAEPGDRIVVFGSFLTVAAALQWLHAQPHS